MVFKKKEPEKLIKYNKDGSVRKPQSPGRTEKPIDWDKVDELLMAGCPAKEIAPHFNLTRERFCERFQAHHGTDFSIYSTEIYSKGHSLLRYKQYKKAIEGNTQMMVWLGKNNLKQVDTPVITEAPLDAVLDSDNENMELKARLAKAEEMIAKLLAKSESEKPDAD